MRIRIKTVLLAVTLMLISLATLSAQDNKLRQTLKWAGDDNVFEYMVEITDIGSGKSEFINTTKNSISISKAPGQYKYRVYAMDFLGRKASVSEWQNFTIEKAIKPQIVSDKKEFMLPVPESPDIKPVVEIPVEILNLTKDSKIVLQNTQTKKIVKAKVQPPSNGQAKQKIVAAEELTEGEWKVKVTNPGGFKAESEVIEVKEDVEGIRIAAEKRAAEERRLAELKRQAEEAERARLAEAKRLEEEKARKAALEKARAEVKALSPEELIKKERTEISKMTEPQLDFNAVWDFTVRPSEVSTEHRDYKDCFIVPSEGKGAELSLTGKSVCWSNQLNNGKGVQIDKSLVECNPETAVKDGQGTFTLTLLGQSDVMLFVRNNAAGSEINDLMYRWICVRYQEKQTLVKYSNFKTKKIKAINMKNLPAGDYQISISGLVVVAIVCRGEFSESQHEARKNLISERTAARAAALAAATFAAREAEKIALAKKAAEEVAAASLMASKEASRLAAEAERLAKEESQKKLLEEQSRKRAEEEFLAQKIEEERKALELAQQLLVEKNGKQEAEPEEEFEAEVEETSPVEGELSADGESPSVIKRKVKRKYKTYSVYNFGTRPAGLNIRNYAAYDKLIPPAIGSGADLKAEFEMGMWDPDGAVVTKGTGQKPEIFFNGSFKNSFALKLNVRSNIILYVSGAAGSSDNWISVLDKNFAELETYKFIAENAYQKFVIKNLPAGEYLIVPECMRIHSLKLALELEQNENKEYVPRKLTPEELEMEKQKFLSSYESPELAAYREQLEKQARKLAEEKVNIESIDFSTLTPEEARKRLSDVKVRKDKRILNLENKKQTQTFKGYCVYDFVSRVNGMLYNSRYKTGFNFYYGNIKPAAGVGAELLISGSRLRQTQHSSIEAWGKSLDVPVNKARVDNYLKFSVHTKSDITILLSKGEEPKANNHWIMVKNEDDELLTYADGFSEKDLRAFTVKNLEPGDYSFIFMGVQIYAAVVSLSEEDGNLDVSQVQALQDALIRQRKKNNEKRTAQATFQGGINLCAGAVPSDLGNSFIFDICGKSILPAVDVKAGGTWNVPEFLSLRLGGELDLTGTKDSIKSDYCTVDLFAENISMNFVLEYELREDRIFTGLRIGPGLFAVEKRNSYEFDIQGGAKTYLAISGQAGAYVKYRPIRNFEVEAGTDAIKVIGNLDSLLIKPYIGAGWRW